MASREEVSHCQHANISIKRRFQIANEQGFLNFTGDPIN